jgi:predicted MFS family arabinose efflux permease
MQEMVGRDDLMNAIALNSTMVNGARVVGPAVAGALVAAVGEGWCFFLNGISFIAVIVGLLMMKVTRIERPRPAGSAIAHTLEGFTYVHRTRRIRAVLLLLGIVSLTAMPYSVLMPVFADQILGGGPRTLGFLTGASGVGALLGAVALAARKGERGLGRWIAAATFAFGITLMFFAWSRTLWLSMAILVLAGGAMMTQMAGSNTAIQTMSPEALRGRVMAVYAMMFLGMAPFGALFAGAVAERIGAPMTVSIGGVVCLIAGAIFALRLPALRGPARQLVVAHEVVATD